MIEDADFELIPSPLDSSSASTWEVRRDRVPVTTLLRLVWTAAVPVIQTDPKNSKPPQWFTVWVGYPETIMNFR